MNLYFRHLSRAGNEALEAGRRPDGQVNLPLPKSRDDAALHKAKTLQTKTKTT